MHSQSGQSLDRWTRVKNWIIIWPSDISLGLVCVHTRMHMCVCVLNIEWIQISTQGLLQPGFRLRLKNNKEIAQDPKASKQVYICERWWMQFYTLTFRFDLHVMEWAPYSYIEACLDCRKECPVISKSDLSGHQEDILAGRMPTWLFLSSPKAENLQSRVEIQPLMWWCNLRQPRPECHKCLNWKILNWNIWPPAAIIRSSMEF